MPFQSPNQYSVTALKETQGIELELDASVDPSHPTDDIGEES